MASAKRCKHCGTMIQGNNYQEMKDKYLNHMEVEHDTRGEH